MGWRGGSAGGEWRLPGGRGTTLTGSGPARADRLYVLGFEARLTSGDDHLKASFGCMAGTRHLESATSEQAASLQADDAWHHLSTATICSNETDHVMVEIENTGSSELLIRGLALSEVRR